MPTGTVTGLPVSLDGHAADEAVGRAEGDAADAVAAEVLLHFAGQTNADALEVGLDAEGVVDLRQMTFGEFDVEGRADAPGRSCRYAFRSKRR